uniref:Putative conserved secreted protein n=1 Tax=Panstrongylus megistus TaxID=65343 RepID=A0A069DMY6_9HEMI
MASSRLKGWKYVLFMTGIVGSIGAATYPIIIRPMLYTEEYKKIQAVTRKNIKQEDIQPGNMKIWSDPFGRDKK